MSIRPRRQYFPAWANKGGIDKVYLLWAAGTSCFKIGYTSGPISRRVSEIQISSPLSVYFLAAAYGTREDESAAHRLLKPFHLRGEWFDFYGQEALFNTLLKAFGQMRLTDFHWERYLNGGTPLEIHTGIH